MAFADEMRTLAEDIASGYEERKEALTAVRETVHSIKEATENLREEFRREIAAMKAEVKTLREEASDLVADFKRERKRAAAAWHEVLGKIHTGGPARTTKKKKRAKEKEE